MDAEIVRDGSALERVYEEWDALAVAAGRPYCAPAWMLAWWRHAAPPGAELRAIVTRDAGEVVAIAPFFADRRLGLARWRLLGSGTSSRREPLARMGVEEEAATSFLRAIASGDRVPDLLVLEGVPAESPWPRQLASAAGDEPAWAHVDWTTPAPTLDLRGKTYEAWFTGKSANFRNQMRRAQRQLEEQGGVHRLAADADRLDGDLRAFASLHLARWQSRGGSQALALPVQAMLADVARRLPPSRFRLWSTDLGGRTISSHLFLAAGGEVAYWLGGFDDAWAAQRPALLTILAAIEHSFEQGDTRVDLGAGGQHYKYRFSDGEDLLRTVTLVPRGRRFRRTRAALVPDHARRALATHLPERWKAPLRRLRAR